MAEQTVTNGATQAKRKKNKRFKAFKGFITGKKSRGRKSRTLNPDPSPTLPPHGTHTSPPPIIPDDPTVWGADFDNQSVASSKAGSTEDDPSNVDGIHIILLLMDPGTRRFELLQLEFDSRIAIVEDIFSQISSSATEPSLKSQTYVDICTPKGIKLEKSKMLSEYATKATVVIAVPEFPNGVDSVEAATKMAKPILGNPRVKKMLISSGLDFPISPISNPLEPVQDEPPSPEPAKTIEVKPVKEEEKPVPVETGPKEEKESLSFLSLVLIVAILAHFFMKVESNITSPLGPGDSLAPGQWKSKCGMAGLLPMSKCSPAAVEMGNDGIFKVFDGEEVAFSLIGSTCSGMGDDCVDDLIVRSDGTITIGGTVGKASAKSSIPLNPWPFTEDVVISSGRGKKRG